MKDELLNLLAAACVIIAGKQGERPNNTPTDAELEAAIGMQVSLAQICACHWPVLAWLPQTWRCADCHPLGILGWEILTQISQCMGLMRDGMQFACAGTCITNDLQAYTISDALDLAQWLTAPLHWHRNCPHLRTGQLFIITAAV